MKKYHSHTLSHRLTSVVVAFLSLAMIGLVVKTSLGDSNERAQKAGCKKHLYDLYKASTIFAMTSRDEGGGDGLYPYKSDAKGPQDVLMLMVKAGILGKPAKLKCPAADGPKAKANPNFDASKPRPWKAEEAPFQLTDATTYYGYAKSRVFSDTGNPHTVLAGDRWIRDGKKNTVSNNHRGGRFFLTAPGRVKWAKKGAQNYQKYLGQLLVKLKNPKKFQATFQAIQKKAKAKKNLKEKAKKFFRENYSEKLVEVGAKLYQEVIYEKYNQQLKKALTGQETSALGALRTILSAQQQFRTLRKDGSNYATLKTLGKEELISKSLASGQKDGYQFKINLSKDKQSFEATAVPIKGKGKDKGRGFFVNNYGQITYTKDGSPPTAKSDELPSRVSSRPDTYKNLSFSEALKKASPQQKKPWNQLLKTLAEGDKEKIKLYTFGARPEVRKKLEKKLALLFYEFIKMLQPLLKDISLRDDPKFQTKVQNFSHKMVPLQDALFGKKYGEKEIQMIIKVTSQYLSAEKATEVKDFFTRFKEAKKEAKKRRESTFSESRALAAMRTIFTAQQMYRTLRKEGGKYAASLKELGNQSLIDKKLGSGKKYGYEFKVTRSKEGWNFTVVATPIKQRKGARNFYVDRSGTIRFTRDGSVPDKNSPSVD